MPDFLITATVETVQVVETTEEVVVVATEQQVQLIEAREIIEVHSDGGGVQSFAFSNITQFTATHNLGRSVIASVIDGSGNQIHVQTTQTQNSVTIYSNVSISGKLIIN